MPEMDSSSSFAGTLPQRLAIANVEDGSACVSCFSRLRVPNINDRMAQNYWLVKQEPEAYSWTTFVTEGGTSWTGIRNFQARNNLRAMKKGDPVLFYHSGESKEIVGIARVAREAYPDPTATEGDWSGVDLVPVKPLKRPVSRQIIKADKALKDILLIRNSRLSAMPLTEAQFNRILELAGTKL
jgi:predicted RNA-binding protein with PUA-like domain